MKELYKHDLKELVQSEGLEPLLANSLPAGVSIRDGYVERLLTQYWSALGDKGKAAQHYQQTLITKLAQYLSVAVPQREERAASPSKDSSLDWSSRLLEWCDGVTEIGEVIQAEETEILYVLKAKRTQRCYVRGHADGLVLYSRAVDLGPHPSHEELFKASALAAKNQYRFALGLEKAHGVWELRLGSFIPVEVVSKDLFLARLAWVCTVADYLEKTFGDADHF